MVIAVASFALVLGTGRRVGTGIGSAAPTPVRAGAAEEFLEGELAAGDLWESRRPLPAHLVAHFSQLVASAAAPIDDVRGTANYRTRALAVMAGRALSWAWTEYQGTLTVRLQANGQLAPV